MTRQNEKSREILSLTAFFKTDMAQTTIETALSDGPGPVDRIVENRGERHADRLHIPSPVDDHLLQMVQLCRVLVGVPDTHLHNRTLWRDA